MRINLLPHREQKRLARQRQFVTLVVSLAVLGAAIVALFWTATTPSTALLRVGVGFGVVSLLTLWLLPKQASVRGEPVDEP